MISSTFSPCQQLNDIIVGEVVQRSRSRRSGQLVAADYIFETTDNNLVTSSQTLIHIQVDSEGASLPKNQCVRRSRGMNLSSKPTTKFTLASENHDASAIPSHQEIISLQDKFIWKTQQQRETITQPTTRPVDEIFQSALHQRELRRRSQIRYRNKKRLIEVSLKQDVQRLRDQILQHKLERRILGSRPPTSATPWIVVSEYYRLFRNGIKRSQTPASNSTSEPMSFAPSDIQMNFLREVMSPDVRVNSGFGVECIIQEWLAVPLMHQGITVHLVRLEYDESDMILATVKVCVTITEEMLRCEFPYFDDRIQDRQTSRFMAKLVGQQLVIPTSTRFEWDHVEHRVLSRHYNVDLVTPFLKILGNVRDTGRVLDNSLLSLATSS